MPANLENSTVATRLEKVSFLSTPKEGQCQRMFKLLHICTHSYASKLMLKILQARLQKYMNWEIPDVQRQRNQRSNCQHPLDHWKSKRIPEKKNQTSISALLTMPKPLTVWITINCGKFWKRWEYQTTWPASSEICMEVWKQQLELGVELQTGSKSGKEYVKGVYCHPAYLTSMQTTSWEMLV